MDPVQMLNDRNVALARAVAELQEAVRLRDVRIDHMGKAVAQRDSAIVGLQMTLSGLLLVAGGSHVDDDGVLQIREGALTLPAAIRKDIETTSYKYQLGFFVDEATGDRTFICRQSTPEEIATHEKLVAEHEAAQQKAAADAKAAEHAPRIVDAMGRPLAPSRKLIVM